MSIVELAIGEAGFGFSNSGGYGILGVAASGGIDKFNQLQSTRNIGRFCRKSRTYLAYNVILLLLYLLIYCIQ